MRFSRVFLLPGLGQMLPSPLKKPMSLIPCGPQACGSEWSSQDDTGLRQAFGPSDHAPLSPQSSVASSGSEQTEDQGSARNTFQEDGSGMKGQRARPPPPRRCYKQSYGHPAVVT